MYFSTFIQIAFFFPHLMNLQQLNLPSGTSEFQEFSPLGGGYKKKHSYVQKRELSL